MNLVDDADGFWTFTLDSTIVHFNHHTSLVNSAKICITSISIESVEDDVKCIALGTLPNKAMNEFNRKRNDVLVAITLNLNWC